MGGRPRSGDLGGEQVEGRRAVAALLAVGRRRVREVSMVDGLRDSPILAEIRDCARARRVPIRMVSHAQLQAQATTTAPQGVLARADALNEADLDDLLIQRNAPAEKPFLLALDGITDPQNLGALLRTAEAAGVTGVLIPRHRSARVTATVAKAAAGAIESLAIAGVAGMPSALARAREKGCWVVGLDGVATSCLFDTPVATDAIVVVLGAEGGGLSRLTRQRCDLVVSIPMAGSVSSLNVSAAGALALFEIRRRRAPSGG